MTAAAVLAPASAVGAADQTVHTRCCHPHAALCGTPLHGHTNLTGQPTDPTRDCVMCAALHDQPCSPECPWTT